MKTSPPPFFFQHIFLDRIHLIFSISRLDSESPDFVTAVQTLKENPKVSPTGVQFILALIQPDPAVRLGTKGGAEAVRSHPWFAGFDWDALANATMPAPYKPDITKKNVDRRISVMDLEEQLVGFKAYAPKVDREKQVLFQEYFLNTELSTEDAAFVDKQKGCIVCVIS
jgi:hypothetical protein